MKQNAEFKLTTLSTHIDIIEKLQELSTESGLSTDQIVLYCLARYSKEVKVKLNLERLSKYQSRCKMYKPLPVKLPQAFYEKCFDLRKSLKLSLSFIFALAFVAYLEDLSKSPRIATSPSIKYSYKKNMYSGQHFFENGRHIFVYSWEKPPE